MTPVELAKPGVQDLAIRAGAGIELTVTFTVKGTTTPIDWTGYTFTSVIRKDASARSPILANITVTAAPDPTLGVLTLTSDDCEALAEGKYYYDVRAAVAGHPPRFVLAGVLEVKGSVTRA